MKIAELDGTIEGRRLRVTHVATSDIVDCDDEPRLMGQEGKATRLIKADGSGLTQLWVDWDEAGPGSLMLMAQDEIEILP